MRTIYSSSVRVMPAVLLAMNVFCATAQDIRTRNEAPAATSPESVPTTSYQLVPGIYTTADEVVRRSPKYAGNLVAPNPMQETLTYLDGRGRKRRVSATDAYAYSDGITLYVRKPNIMRPNRFDGFVRVVVYASLAVAEPSVPRAQQYVQTSSRPNSAPRTSTSIGMGMGTGRMGGWGMDPLGWGGSGMGWGSGMGMGGWGGPGMGWGGSGMGMNMNIPLGGRGVGGGGPTATGEVAIPINTLQELYMVDMRSGVVQSLDAVYLPAFLRSRDPELYEEWVADTRPMHERSKQLHFVRRYNQRHPLVPASQSL